MTDIRSLFDEIKETNEGFRANCPSCGDDKQRLYWNEDKRLGCCFHAGCDHHPNKGGISEKELREILKDPAAYTKVLDRDVEPTEIVLPDEFRYLRNLRPLLRNTVTAYLEGRGLDRKVLDMANVGYCETGKFWGYIVMPLYEKEELVYWQARRFKNRTPKFWNPASSKKESLLPTLGNPKRRCAVIVESVLNGLTLFEKPLLKHWMVFVMLGKTLSDSQLRKIRVQYEHLDKIVIALDPDAWKEEVNMGRKLCGAMPSTEIYLARIPEGEDVNSLGHDKSWERIRRAELFQPDQIQKYFRETL